MYDSHNFPPTSWSIYIYPLLLHCLSFPSSPLLHLSLQEFIRHKLEEEQRQLEILQQQLLQEQALLMVTLFLPLSCSHLLSSALVYPYLCLQGILLTLLLLLALHTSHH